MRHHAWLTIPPRAEAVGTRREPERPRRTTLNADSPHLGYPPIDVGGYLVEWLAEAGWARWGDGVASELDWVELRAWADLTQADPTPWEIKAVRALSVTYAASANAAREPGCLPPWPEPEELPPGELDRRRKAFRSALRSSAPSTPRKPERRGNAKLRR